MDNEFAARFLFALANVPGNVASLLLIESLGRRRLLWGSMLLAAFFAFVFAACASPEQPRLVPRQVSLRNTSLRTPVMSLWLNICISVLKA